MLQACLVSAQPITTNKHTIFTLYFFSCFCSNSFQTFLMLLCMVFAFFFNPWFTTFLAIGSIVPFSIWFATLPLKHVRFLDLSACDALLSLHLITLNSNTPLSRFTGWCLMKYWETIHTKEAELAAFCSLACPAARYLRPGATLWFRCLVKSWETEAGSSSLLLKRKKCFQPEKILMQVLHIFEKTLHSGVCEVQASTLGYLHLILQCINTSILCNNKDTLLTHSRLGESRDRLHKKQLVSHTMIPSQRLKLPPTASNASIFD